MPTQPNPCDLLRLLAEQMETGARLLRKWHELTAVSTGGTSPEQPVGATSSLPTTSDSPKKKQPKPPSIPESKAMAQLFNRRPTTLWSVKEQDAFKAAAPTLEDIEMVAAYYEKERAKGDDGWHRRGLLTALNNWPSEVDKAREYAASKAAPVVAGPRDLVAEASQQ